ncbi:MAG: 7-cyano-7-deazaguanine synthase [Pelosinus sp.]|nr:7-cyano-7-deazaguanine synthase [Pelosinus sp.]
MLIVHLKNNRGYQWFEKEGIYCKGYFINQDNKIFSDERTVDYFSNINSENDFLEIMKEVNGFFSVLVQRADKVFVAVDRLRSFPLYYAQTEDNILISDDAYWLRDKIEASIDSAAECEYLSSMYVAGEETLCKSIKQIQAGEIIIINSAKLTAKRYFQYRHKQYFPNDSSMLIEKLDKVHVEVLSRTVKVLNGRMAVIPLSGGYDSRLVAVMLKRLGYENVLCFSYGRHGNLESKVSQQVAKYLGYKWVFVPYTRTLCYQWSHCPEFLAYSRYADGLCTTAHAQDWAAVWQLKMQNILPNDAVFIPGHTGDFIEGGHIPSWLAEDKMYSRQCLIDAIYEKHYSLLDRTIVSQEVRKFVDKKIAAVIGNKEVYSAAEFADAFECYEWQQRQAKFICNSVRVYEFWNYQWTMPLWDNQIMDFWSRVPVSGKVGRQLYFQYVKAKQNISIRFSNSNSSLRWRINKLLDPRYGQFNGKSSYLKAIFMKNNQVFPAIPNKIVSSNAYVYHTDLNALALWNRLLELKNNNI